MPGIWPAPHKNELTAVIKPACAHRVVDISCRLAWRHAVCRTATKPKVEALGLKAPALAHKSERSRRHWYAKTDPRFADINAACEPSWFSSRNRIHFPPSCSRFDLSRESFESLGPHLGLLSHAHWLKVKFQSSNSVASIVHMLFVDLSLKFSFHRLRLRPTEAVHQMSLVSWVSWADWQLRPLEQGVKVKGVVCRSLSSFVYTLGYHCLSETWTDQALCKWFRMTFSST